MNYLIKYSWITLLPLLFSCKEQTCLTEKKEFLHNFNGIRTSKRSFPAKGLWLHRTNQLAKFNEYADAYDGFEMDVNIDTINMRLDVYHPPEKSNNISAADFLKQKKAANKYFWFDCKNLNVKNLSAALMILQQLDSLYAIKNKIVFESHNAAALKQIAAAGYYCFYNVPIKSETELCTDTAFISATALAIDTSFAAITADEEYFNKLQLIFPFCKKATWGINPIKNIFKRREKQLLKDSSVLIVLRRE